MDVFVRVVIRSSSVIDAENQQRKAEAATLWSALRADRRSRDERTARLRAMRLAIGYDG